MGQSCQSLRQDSFLWRWMGGVVGVQREPIAFTRLLVAVRKLKSG